MKKKILKAVLIIFAVAFVGVAVWFACAFFGNPVSEHLATKSAQEYLEANFANTDYAIEDAFYDFKGSNYHVHIKSPASADSSFTICAGLDGKIIYDTYESDVAEKGNTARRIGDEYRKAADKIFDSDTFPYESDICFGDIEFVPASYAENHGIPEYAIITNELELDKSYDLKEFGSKAGHLTVYVQSETVTAEKLAEVLLAIKDLFDENGVTFYVIDCVLEYPKPEDVAQKNDFRVEVKDFLYSDIYEDEMVKRVMDNDEAAKAYWQAEDEKNME